MAKAELMTNLVAHDMASPHKKILLWVINRDTIPFWVIPAERESTHTRGIACPTKAERPAVLRVQVLHCNSEHSVGVCRLVCGHNV